MKPDCATLFRGAVGSATLLMLAMSWPLWVAGSVFPRIPFVLALRPPSIGVSWVVFGFLMLAVAAGIVWRLAMGVAAGLLVFLVLLDQSRFQPWVYQYSLAAIAFVAMPRARSAALCRLFVVSLYVHSGLSKLDASFCQDLGPAFLRAGLIPLGVDSSTWSSSARIAAILAMPLGELALALGLAWGPTRRWASRLAVVMHLTLIAILGPWSLDQSTIVLVWNASQVVEVVALFGGGAGGLLRDLGWPISPVGGLFLLASLLPFGERWGWLDPWPAFALYASHVERVDLSVPAGSVPALPAPVRQFTKGDGHWRTIDLTAWSRSVRGVPVYPGGRASLGIARALASKVPGVRVVLWGRAERWSGRRFRIVAVGLGEIESLAARYRLNSRPDGPGWTSGMPDASQGGIVDD